MHQAGGGEEGAKLSACVKGSLEYGWFGLYLSRLLSLLLLSLLLPCCNNKLMLIALLTTGNDNLCLH